MEKYGSIHFSPLIANFFRRYSEQTTAWFFYGGTADTNAPPIYPAVPGIWTTDVHPGCRYNSALWHDSNDVIWIFGGNVRQNGTLVMQNDIWGYNTTHYFFSGNKTAVPAFYTSIGHVNPQNIPPAVVSASYWTYGSNLYLYGGENSIP